MPVIFYHNGVKFFFFSNEGSPLECIHVHVRKDEKLAKIWVEPELHLESSYGFTLKEIKAIMNVVKIRKAEIIEAWNEHFDS
ncbi:DUF4160 domain-containing protein [bacterium]|nr:DUF4160 domain-containing protein [bacterium]